MRDMRKAGDEVLEVYLSQLFDFSMASYQMPSESVNFHAAKLNHLWQRIYFESMALNIACQGRIESILIELITCFLDNKLAHMARNPYASEVNDDEEADDEDENFDKRERTQKHDDLDSFAKLMRQKIIDSMQLILSRITQLIQQYEVSLVSLPGAKICER